MVKLPNKALMEACEIANRLPPYPNKWWKQKMERTATHLQLRLGLEQQQAVPFYLHLHKMLLKIATELQELYVVKFFLSFGNPHLPDDHRDKHSLLSP